MKYWIHKALIALTVLAVVGGSAAWYLHRDSGQSTPYRTTQVARGDLVVSIGATGTLEPEEVIDVGAQVAGRIVSFGKDANGNTVDYGSPVEAGTVLAKIDDVVYAAQAAEAAAQLQQAQAGLQVAQANLAQAKAKLDQAQRDWDRAQKLGPSEALAQASYDSYRSAFETAQANVGVAEASILQAQAQVAQSQAARERAQQNLDYCTIRSPVKGVIIDRRVNTGQTVVASLNAPSLFLLAKDLTHMQVWVAVNEADIGKIHPGQPVSFTVSAFPDRMFRGTVGKVRLNASMTQNVVTYTVEVLTDNSSGILLPYLTADVEFEQARHDNVLMVPNGALRWTPTAEQIDPRFRNSQAPAAADSKRPAVSNPPSASRNPQSEGDSGRGILWVVDGKYVRPLPVRTGLSNTQMTEVQGEGLAEGLEIVTGGQTQGAQMGTTNPFAPRFPRRSSGSGTGGAGGPGAPGAPGGAGGARPR
jgi:HlyD family secretion protein